MQTSEGGRVGEKSSKGLSDCLRALGLTVLRLKTGTCGAFDRRKHRFFGK
jgi:tRNA U34 5-carboxymethylaminomethyl modifying enzyme MnmG/GidA